MFSVAAAASAGRGELDVARIYAQHGELILRHLHRLGVPTADIADAAQEVLIVVHRRLDTFAGDAKLSTWLYGICARVAANQRRRVRRRREDPIDSVVHSDDLTEPRNPERLVAEQRAREELRRILELLDPEKRATFVMFELEGATCGEIAEAMGVPVGTVFSRLHAARQVFRHELDRQARRELFAERVEPRRVGT